MGSEHVTQAEFARRKGTTPQAVSAALTSGRIRRGPGGRLNWEEASAAWDATSRPGGGELGKRRRIDPGELADLDAARLEVEREKARQLRLRNDAEERRLVPADDVRRLSFAAIRSLRDRLLALPGRLAPPLAASTDEHSCRVLLEREIRATLEAIAEDWTP